MVETYSQNSFAELDRKLEANQEKLGMDLVMLVWKGDSLIYKKEMGDFNAKTLAPIASCSKWLTAALVMQFVDEGKLSLDDKVGRWLPEFDRYGKSYITIRHCLSHMTGISDEGKPVKKIIQRRQFGSLEEEVNSFAAKKIRVNAGEDFWYGNIGLNIAGRVLEVISRKKFDQLIKQKLFNPLAMRRTTFTTIDASAINPSGGARSNAEEYMRFLAMLLNKGKSNGKQILSEASVEELFRIHTKASDIKYAPKSAAGLNYALGSWVIEENDGKSIALASPGLFGTWPMIDRCRGYASLVLVKSLLGEERAEIHGELKTAIDEQLPSTCN
jgi:CubicO group peptidase (beta-lactamase class C family)